MLFVCILLFFYHLFIQNLYKISFIIHFITHFRYYFLWEQQSFHIYEYVYPDNGLWTLQCQSQQTEPILPKFLKIKDELNILDNQNYSSYYISMKKRQHSLSTDSINSLLGIPNE